MNLSVDVSIPARTPDPTPVTTSPTPVKIAPAPVTTSQTAVTISGFATVPTPVPTPVPAPIPDPPYEVNLSEEARSAPTRLGAKLSLELL
jgi:chitin-binding protein